MATGHIVQVQGPVVDLGFAPGELPSIYNAVVISNEEKHIDLTVEVAQHLGNDVVRCIAMSSTDGLVRGMPAEDTGGPITVPVGRETLDKIARRDDFDSELSDELDRARIDASDVGDRAARRIFHRDALLICKQAANPGLQLVASGILFRCARQMVQSVTFDGVDETPWLRRSRNEVVPTSRRQMAALPPDRRELDGNRVQAAEIVEQPTVEAIGAQRRLNGRHVEPRRFVKRRLRDCHRSSIARAAAPLGAF